MENVFHYLDVFLSLSSEQFLSTIFFFLLVFSFISILDLIFSLTLRFAEFILSSISRSRKERRSDDKFRFKRLDK